jgi:SAM-dependent methyltransferase
MSGPEPLRPALERLRSLVVDPDVLVRAVASGRRKGSTPRWRRVELRWVDLKGEPHLQLTAYDDTQAHTSNHPAGAAAEQAVGALLDEPFGNWHVEEVSGTHQLRTTKRLEALVHSTERAEPVAVDRAHDREKDRVLAEDDPVLVALGISDAHGRVKPSRRAKYHQVEELVRILDVAVTDAMASGALRRPTTEDPLRVVDLGCGNAYLTFAAHRLLSGLRGLPVALTGVDVKEQSRRHNAEVAARLGIDADFVVGSIADAAVAPAPEVVLALHACDTATDDALARAVGWEAPLVLAAPCCHHDLAAQLRAAPTPAPYSLLTRHGILRERLADTLTDGVRAALLRSTGYRVDVIEFVGSEHTPRNTLLRAVRTGAGRRDDARREYDELVGTWGIRPRLGELLGA